MQVLIQNNKLGDMRLVRGISEFVSVCTEEETVTLAVQFIYLAAECTMRGSFGVSIIRDSPKINYTAVKKLFLNKKKYKQESMKYSLGINVLPLVICHLLCTTAC